MLSHVREGDMVLVHEISRLARNTADLLALVKQLTDKGRKHHVQKRGSYLHWRQNQRDESNAANDAGRRIVVRTRND
jgi:hypothetical protein